MPMKLMKPSSYLPLPSKHTALLLKKINVSDPPPQRLPPFFISFSFFLFFLFSLPKKTPLPKVSTCCTIHHLSRSGAPTTTMALVTCSAMCLQQLASRSWSPSPPLQEAVVHPGWSMRGLHIVYSIIKMR